MNYKRLIEAFKVFETDEKGKIDADILKYGLTNLGDKLPESLVDDIIKIAKDNNN